MSIDLAEYAGLVDLYAPVRAPRPLAADEIGSTALDLLSRLGGPATATPQDAVRLLRARLTELAPGAVDPQSRDLIDRLLQALARQHAPVLPDDLPRLTGTSYPVGERTSLWRGDITTLAADAIVNAANAQMLGCFVPFHACIDNAIHWAAGPQLRDDCARIMERQGHHEPTGMAKATRAYNLPSRFVLHTVGPIVRGAPSAADADLLAACYRACLDLAARLPEVRSVAFCAISTGVFGYPKAAAAQVALRTVADWLTTRRSRLHVIFNVFSVEDEAIYRKALTGWRPGS